MPPISHISALHLKSPGSICPIQLHLIALHIAAVYLRAYPPNRIIMASIHSTISALRSRIFDTIHNPTNARTGAKYLRRPLRGAAITKYYPKLPNLARLNAQIASNRYANWAGVTASSLEKKEGAVIAARQLGTQEEMVGAGLTEVERRQGAGWLEDERERVRRTEVELRHKLGKGPPKKGTSECDNGNVRKRGELTMSVGQGRRSQMKKR